MAQFIGIVNGEKRASACGDKTTGLQVTANAWNIGAQIDLVHDNGEDILIIYITSGSNDTYPKKELLRLNQKNLVGHLARMITD